jgi:holliday junction DNA helicase RuvA
VISLLSGEMLSKSPTEVCILVHGVGLTVSIPLSTYERIGQTGDNLVLHTYLHVREDALQLYGFFAMDEREMFKLLLSVSGIGPRMALAVLSGTSVDSLRHRLSIGDAAGLMSVPGIGKKLAERLVVELREKVSRMNAADQTRTPGSISANGIRSEAALALTSLGYSRQSAEKAVQQAIEGLRKEDVTLEELIKAALRTTGH